MEDKPLMLDGLDGYQFEELIAKIMKKKGYNHIKVTSKSRDKGRDIVMKGDKGEVILIECKHQKFVGRPIIQKLQGAMNHVETQQPDKEVEGMIVTSGIFSDEALEYNKEIGHKIDLIDGKKLKALCKDLHVVILNGKVQILANKSFRNISEQESKDLASRGYGKIYGHADHKPSIKSEMRFQPACLIKYNVNFDTHTSVGCVDSYSDSGEIIVDGVTGKDLEDEEKNFFFSSRIDSEDIKDKETHLKTPFEFTENDIEEHAINSIIEEHTHDVSYSGNNNVSYSKTCCPKRRDIDIKQFLPLYLPTWTNEIKIKKYEYKQKFYAKGNNKLFTIDDLKTCKICDSERGEYEDMSICPECGRIVCSRHVKIDYLDKETPICTIHAKPFKLYLQSKYFATQDNLKEYKKKWEAMNFFKKLYEDKIAFGLSMGGLIFLGFIVISAIGA